MLYVGGGAGMALMRSHLYQLFRTIKVEERLIFGTVVDLKESCFMLIISEL